MILVGSLLGSVQMQLWKRQLCRKYDAVKRNFKIRECPSIEENGLHLDNDEVIASFIYKDEA